MLDNNKNKTNLLGGETLLKVEEQYIKNLEQAKKRNSKIMITDIAISKVPRTGIFNFSNNQNKLIQAYHREILRVSKNVNNSDEIAVIVRLDLISKNQVDKLDVNAVNNPNDIWLYGVTNKVIFEGTEAEYRIKFSPYRTILIMHNHPCTQNFSYGDISLLVNNLSVFGITVVTNTGETHILCKTPLFNYDELKKIYVRYKKEYRRRL